MKKIFTFLAAVTVSLTVFAGNYGVLVNGKTYYAATPLPNKDYQNRDQFLASVSLVQGDKWCIYDADNKAPFTIVMEAGDGSAKGNFTEGADAATCNVAGCYDFYIKLKWEDNSLWVQAGTDCSATGTEIDGGGEGGGGGQGGEGGGQGGQGGESGEGYNFAFIGSIGGDWNVTEIKEEYTFDERGRWTGSLAAHPQKPGAAYVVIADHVGNQYKTKGWQGEDAQKVTLYWANGFEDSNVWQLPTEQTLYIIMRSCTFKGEIEVERVDKATYDAYTIDWGTQDVEETTVGEKARKVFVNGQLRIIRGDKVFDATGREIK